MTTPISKVGMVGRFAGSGRVTGAGVAGEGVKPASVVVSQGDSRGVSELLWFVMDAAVLLATLVYFLSSVYGVMWYGLVEGIESARSRLIFVLDCVVSVYEGFVVLLSRLFQFRVTGLFVPSAGGAYIVKTGILYRLLYKAFSTKLLQFADSRVDGGYAVVVARVAVAISCLVGGDTGAFLWMTTMFLTSVVVRDSVVVKSRKFMLASFFSLFFCGEMRVVFLLMESCAGFVWTGSFLRVQRGIEELLEWVGRSFWRQAVRLERFDQRPSGVWAEFSKRTCMDLHGGEQLLPVREILSAKLDSGGSSGAKQDSGGSSSAKLRTFALFGDRALELSLIGYVVERGGSVGAISGVSQVLVSNEALAAFFDKHLSDLVVSFKNRSVKKKATLVEGLVGVAYRSHGMGEVDKFVKLLLAFKGLDLEVVVGKSS